MLVANVPLVSIIIPCYNAAQHIGEALESTLAQNHTKVEVIVIDDGSTDESLNVIESYGDRLRWETGPNRGVNSARKRGVELARGEFFQFLDADDILMPPKIEACLEAFTDDVDVVFCGLEHFGSSAKREHFTRSWLYRALIWLDPASARPDQCEWEPDNPLEFFIRRGIQTAQPLHRASFYRKTDGFREDLMQCDDYEFHYRLALMGARFKRIEPVLVRYREHDSTDRIRHSNESATYVMRALTVMTEQTAQANTLNRSLRRALAHRFALNARVFMRRGLPETATALYEKARDLVWLPRSGRLVFDLLAATIGLEKAEVSYLRLRGVKPGSSGDPS